MGGFYPERKRPDNSKKSREAPFFSGNTSTRMKLSLYIGNQLRLYCVLIFGFFNSGLIEILSSMKKSSPRRGNEKHF